MILPLHMSLTKNNINLLNSKFLLNGLDEIVKVDGKSSICESLVEYSIDLPQIPKRFKHLYDNLDTSEYEKKYAPAGVCDCAGDEQPYLECPHL